MQALVVWRSSEEIVVVWGAKFYFSLKNTPISVLNYIKTKILSNNPKHKILKLLLLLYHIKTFFQKKKKKGTTKRVDY